MLLTKLKGLAALSLCTCLLGTGLGAYVLAGQANSTGQPITERKPAEASPAVGGYLKEEDALGLVRRELEDLRGKRQQRDDEPQRDDKNKPLPLPQAGVVTLPFQRLAKVIADNAAAVDTLYVGHRIEVTGPVQRINRDNKKRYLLTMHSWESKTTVVLTAVFDEKHRPALAGLTAGTVVTLTGLCERVHYLGLSDSRHIAIDVSDATLANASRKH